MSDFIYRYEAGQTIDQPTILALHGTGGTENDLVELAQSFWPGAHILAPRGRVSENGAARFFRRIAEGVFDLESLRQETDALADFVAAKARQYGFAANDVFALGYSNGANIAASLLLSHPETLAGAILLRAMTPFTPSKIPDLEGKPIFLAGGRHDPLVPMENIDNLARMLETARADVTLRFENAAHNLSSAEIEAVRVFIKSRF